MRARVLITFDGELYRPESEASIRDKAFEIKYAPEGEFLPLLRKGNAAAHSYDPRNTRALVEYKGQVYFIDRFGNVRHDKAFSTIDAHAFEHRLVSACTDRKPSR